MGNATRDRTFFGVDPGTNATGYGVIRVVDNVVRWVESGTVFAGRSQALPARLACIYERVSEKIERHVPCVVCVEQAFYAKNAHTALILGHARGVILLAAQRAGAELMEFSPREIKKAVVGNGNAGKEQVSFMIKALLSPPAESAQTDACDALAAALCGFYHYRPLGAAAERAAAPGTPNVRSATRNGSNV